MKKQLNIDFISYLNDRGIRYWTSGKNVKSGEVNISCWACGDRSNHLRIKPHGYIQCWKCGNEGWFYEAIRYFDNCDYYEAKKIAAKYESSGPIIIAQKEETSHKDFSSFSLPFGVKPYLYKMHKEYLAGRGFDPEELAFKYSLHSCLHDNTKWKYRLIVPIMVGGRMISYLGRDVSGKREPRYLDALEKDTVIPKRDTLYNLDSVKNDDTMIIVEGCADVWRVGDGCVATMTTNFTISQANLIRKKSPKRVFICYDNPEFDPNTKKKVEELEKYLHFVPELYKIDLPNGVKDPGELSNGDVRQMRTEIFGRL